MTRPTLVGRTCHTITIRMPDGVERVFDGQDVILVWCKEADLDAQIAQRPHRATEVSCTISDAGPKRQVLVLTGSANYA